MLSNLRPLRRNWSNFCWMWQLRNRYRDCFLNSDPISLWQHWKWWKSYWKFRSGWKVFFEVLTADRKVGGYISRTQHSEKLIEIGNLVVKPSSARIGIMTTAVEWLTVDPSATYIAMVFEDNFSSRNVFIRAGFKKHGIKLHLGRRVITWLKGREGHEAEIDDLE